MNWTKLISELQGAGFSREKIAEECHCSKCLINKLASGDRGKRLSFAIANSLINLHKKEVAEKASQ